MNLIIEYGNESDLELVVKMCFIFEINTGLFFTFSLGDNKTRNNSM